MSALPLWLRAAPFIFLMFWSAGFVFAKVGLRAAEPLTLLVLRYALVVAAMGVLFVILRPALPRTRGDWGHLALVGVLMQTVYFGFSYLAFDTGISAGLVALLMALQPILVGIIAPVWSAERVGWRRWAGLMMGLGGTAVVILARLEIAVPPVNGLIFSLIALGGIIAATLWEKRFGQTHHPVTANLVGFAAGLVVILPAALFLETGRVDWTWELAGALGYLVVCNSLIATSLLLAMIRAGEVSRVSALMFLVPPMAAVLAWLILDEAMPPLAWAGMALAAAGVLVATRAR